jgi:hypothetical protein
MFGIESLNSLIMKDLRLSREYNKANSEFYENRKKNN